MATMAEIRAGLAASLAPLNQTWSVNPYSTSMSHPPYFTVVGAAIDFDTTMRRGSDTQYWTLLACVAATTDQGSGQLLETIVDPVSTSAVKALVEADVTLGGVVSWARVVSVTKPALYAFAGQPESLGVEFTIEVMT